MNLGDPMLARALAVALLLATSAAHADDTSAARELYDRGVRMYNLQQFDGALDAFQAAYSAKPDPTLLFNIAQCQRQLRQYEAAGRSYKAFLANAPDSPDGAVAARMAHEMDERTATPAPGSTVVAAPPSPSMSAAPENVSRKAPAPEEKRRPLRLAGIGATGLGAGLVVAGIVFAIVSAQEGEKAWHGAAYDYDADQRRAGFKAGAIASFAVGGAAAAAGTALLVLGRRR